MKKGWLSILIVFVAVNFSFAAEKGTAPEAKALVGKAAAYVKAVGKDKAMAEFNNPKGKFINKDLYIFVVDFKGITLANGGNAKLAGRDMSGLQDANGKFFIKEMITLAKAKGSGWIDYKWTNAVTKKVEPKSSYVQRVDDYFIGCGIYK